MPELRISPFSLRFIISLIVILSKKSGLIDFQKFLLPVINFEFKFEKCCFFLLFAKGLHISCAVSCKHFEKYHFYFRENHYVILIFSLQPSLTVLPQNWYDSPLDSYSLVEHTCPKQLGIF